MSLIFVGNHSSSTLSQGWVAFKIFAPTAARVLLAGDFTGWYTSPKPMDRDENGFWGLCLLLKSGIHGYKFIVNGEWTDAKEIDATRCIRDGHRVTPQLFAS